jgi:uncharacterized hydrophobic protein (TIGR00271 family)
MAYNFLDNFRLHHEKEDYQIVTERIKNGIVFKNTNLWILIFAIFVASLGLNVNSTAVIIGAMLISPLMGPIMGLGLGMGIYDVSLLKKALYNYLFATGIALLSSTIYFVLSPLSEAHSELLARTSPTIYDVLIALFGGLAGILATASKQKGNVLPGVAIATALMPPLCTAGFGLATLNWTFFFGALYLFIINTVFIALATLITVRLLKFPVKQLLDKKDELKAKRLVFAIVSITLVPSIYFGYDMVKQNEFKNTAVHFIDNEGTFKNDYLLKKIIDTKQKSIVLVFGGRLITENEISTLQSKLKNYNLESATLEIKQGFSSLAENKDNEQIVQLTNSLEQKDKELERINLQLDSIKNVDAFNAQLLKEIQVLYPNVSSVAFAPIKFLESKSKSNKNIVAYFQFVKPPKKEEQEQLNNWLNVKMSANVTLIISKK